MTRARLRKRNRRQVRLTVSERGVCYSGSNALPDSACSLLVFPCFPSPVSFRTNPNGPTTATMREAAGFRRSRRSIGPTSSSWLLPGPTTPANSRSATRIAPLNARRLSSTARSISRLHPAGLSLLIQKRAASAGFLTHKPERRSGSSSNIEESLIGNPRTDGTSESCTALSTAN